MGNAAGIEGQRPNDTEGGDQESFSEDYLDDLAQKLHVTREEVVVLYERFILLRPDSEGLVNRNVFEKPPYSNDPFCKQIWMRISGEEKDQAKFSFLNFAKTLIWWQKAPQHFKMEVLFSWMTGSDGVNPTALAKILCSIEPKYCETELRVKAKQLVHMMVGCSGSAKKTDIVKIEDFLTWCGQLPRDKLDKSMEFKIRNTTKNGASISNMQS